MIAGILHLLSSLIFAATVSHAFQHSGVPLFVETTAASGASTGNRGCVDLDSRCGLWASQGECNKNAAWMMGNCRRSCKSCQGGDRAWSLRAHLAEHYDNQSKGSNFTINSVAIDSLAVDHVEIEEARQLVQFHGRIVLTWNDSRVQWDKTQWGVSWLNFYWIQVWTPEVVQTNSPPAITSRMERKILAANYTGQVFMWADYSFTVPCEFDYSSFPDDVQKCCAKIDDKKYYAVRFSTSDTAQREASRSASKAHLAGWALKDVVLQTSQYAVELISDWETDPYGMETTNCDVCIVLKRKAAYYASELAGPAVATAVITLTSFASISYWHQTGILMASLALQIVSYGVAAMQVPQVAYGNGTPCLFKFYTFNLAMTIFVLALIQIFQALANYRSTVPPPHSIDTLVALMSRFLPCCGTNSNVEQGHDEHMTMENGTGALPDSKNPGKYYWAPLVGCARVILLVLAMIIYVIMILACFVF